MKWNARLHHYFVSVASLSPPLRISFSCIYLLYFCWLTNFLLSSIIFCPLLFCRCLYIFPNTIFLVLSFYLSYLFICGSTIHHHQRLIFFEIQSSKLLSERLIFNMFLCTHFVMCLHVRIFFEIFYPFSIFFFNLILYSFICLCLCLILTRKTAFVAFHWRQHCKQYLSCPWSGYVCIWRYQFVLTAGNIYKVWWFFLCSH